jgi:hypothetical protein
MTTIDGVAAVLRRQVSRPALRPHPDRVLLAASHRPSAVGHLLREPRRLCWAAATTDVAKWVDPPASVDRDDPRLDPRPER